MSILGTENINRNKTTPAHSAAGKVHQKQIAMPTMCHPQARSAGHTEPGRLPVIPVEGLRWAAVCALAGDLCLPQSRTLEERVSPTFGRMKMGSSAPERAK